MSICNTNAVANAMRRYYTALRCEVKSSGLLLLKRNTGDVFTNNFNLTLMQIHEANLDIQFTFDEYKVAEYVSNYCTKQESGQTSLLKKINDEAIKSGESYMETIKKFATAIDVGNPIFCQIHPGHGLGAGSTWRVAVLVAPKDAP